MSTTYTGQSNTIFKIPRLEAQVNAFHSQSKIVGLAHAYPSADPTNDGFYDWNDPTLTLFTRDLTRDILDLNPVVVLERYLTKARNVNKANVYSRSIKRWVIPGNTSYDGNNFHGGNSGYYRGAPNSLPEIQNFIPLNNNNVVGYNHVMFDNYTLPLSRFVSDPQNGTTYGQLMNRAVYVADWYDNIRYSQMPTYRNYFLKFRVSLAIPNPTWSATNHENRWLFGEGQTIIAEPRLQTFDDGAGELEYFIGWKVKAVN